MEIGGGSEARIAATQAGLTFSGERPLASSHLVQHRAQRENVGARVGFFAFRLSGDMYWNVPTIVPCAVSGWSAEGMWKSSSSNWKPGTLGRGSGFGQAEVHQLGAGLGQHHVGLASSRDGRRRSVRALKSLANFNTDFQHFCFR